MRRRGCRAGPGAFCSGRRQGPAAAASAPAGGSRPPPRLPLPLPARRTQRKGNGGALARPPRRGPARLGSAAADLPVPPAADARLASGRGGSLAGPPRPPPPLLLLLLLRLPRLLLRGRAGGSGRPVPLSPAARRPWPPSWSRRRPVPCRARRRWRRRRMRSTGSTGVGTAAPGRTARPRPGPERGAGGGAQCKAPASPQQLLRPRVMGRPRGGSGGVFPPPAACPRCTGPGRGVASRPNSRPSFPLGAGASAAWFREARVGYCPSNSNAVMERA